MAIRRRKSKRTEVPDDNERMWDAIDVIRTAIAELKQTVMALDNRIQRLEGSDFAKNRTEYEQTMLDLAVSNPGVPLFP